MKCPLFTTAAIDGKGIIDYKRWECLKEECGLWDERRTCCGERTKRLQLERIADFLGEIKDKIPHEGQFRR